MPIVKPCVHSDHPAKRDADPPNAAMMQPPDHHPDWVLLWDAAPRDETANSMTDVPATESAYAIDIFGKSAGVLVANGDGFVFRAADPPFWDLDHRWFECIAEAERAVHVEWLRHQHRRRPGIGSRRRRSL